jgi:hypothetical protein
MTSEIALTSDLAAYLNTASRHAKGWDILQFRTEVPDENQSGRSIDLVPSPCAETIWVDNRSFSYFEILLPIECKRFPIPKKRDRDPREYVISEYSTTGGIQRFKSGHHGSGHVLGAMIGYIQEENAATWFERVSGWINELAEAGKAGWSLNDLLELASATSETNITTYRSTHTRQKKLPEIELLHLWIQMNQ